MNIGVNGRAFSVEEPSGGVQTAIEVTKSLQQLEDLNVICFGHQSIAEHFNQINLDSSYFIKNSQLYGIIWERTILPMIASKYNLDVLYNPNSNGFMFNPSFNNVVCIHDMSPQRGWTSTKMRIYRRAVLSRGAKMADRIVTVSEFSKNEIHSLLKIPKSKIDIVYNGIDPYFLSNEPGVEFDLPNNYILFVGAQNPRKNVKGVIESYLRVKNQTNSDLKLVMIGPNNKSIFKTLNVEETNNIIIPGFISKEELKYAYKNAELFLYPSFYEGFGLPPLEAMACGTPVVASNTSSLPEVLGNAAVFTDPTSIDDIVHEMISLLNNSSKRNKMVARGITHSQKFTWENSLEDLMRVFRSIS
ncbi:MAG: glycosyltransferase family 1 protein [Natrialbaceae archaeon]|nr:glycosyltransferase family 1 protein [Natrialbaceae archaeon]